jgi:hypothetical protein
MYDSNDGVLFFLQTFFYYSKISPGCRKQKFDFDFRDFRLWDLWDFGQVEISLQMEEQSVLLGMKQYPACILSARNFKAKS